MKTTTITAERDEAIALAREAASVLARAQRAGANEDVITRLSELSRECERRVGLAVR